METNLKNLRDHLPFHYGRQIADSLKDKGISAEQVRLVFRGEITNPEIVEPVLQSAHVLAGKMKKITKLKQKAVG